MKKTAGRKEINIMLKDLKENETMIIEFNEQPKEKVREVGSNDLHLALGTMKIGERLLVRFDGNNE